MRRTPGGPALSAPPARPTPRTPASCTRTATTSCSSACTPTGSPRAPRGAQWSRPDFNNLDFTLVGLEPQATVRSGNDAYSYLYYGLPTAQVLDDQTATSPSRYTTTAGLSGVATIGIQLVSAAQEFHESINIPQLTLKVPGELQHNKETTKQGSADVRTLHTLAFKGDIAKGGTITATGDDVVFAGRRNRFPVAQQASGALVPSGSTLQLRHVGVSGGTSATAALDIDGKITKLTIADGGINYAPGNVVRLTGGNLDATATVTTAADIPNGTTIQNSTFTGVANGTNDGTIAQAPTNAGFMVNDVLSLQTDASTNDDTSAVASRVDKVQNSIAVDGVNLLDGEGFVSTTHTLTATGTFGSATLTVTTNPPTRPAHHTSVLNNVYTYADRTWSVAGAGIPAGAFLHEWDQSAAAPVIALKMIDSTTTSRLDATFTSLTAAHDADPRVRRLERRRVCRYGQTETWHPRPSQWTLTP